MARNSVSPTPPLPCNFAEFCESPPSTTFSQEYFEGLTFELCRYINLPLVAAPGHLTSHMFCLEPSDDQSVDRSETVPHSRDLLPITSIMEDRYKEGYRSVLIQMTFADKTVTRQVHFSKIRIYLAINNNLVAVDGASRMVDALRPLLPGLEYYSLLSSRIYAPLVGFKGCSRPLWNLECLLEENWLWDDIVDAALELLYFEHAADHQCTTGNSMSNSPPTTPGFLLLPTSFFVNASTRFTDFPDSFTNEQQHIRWRILSTPVEHIVFLAYSNNHFTAVHHDVHNKVIEHADPLSPVAPANINLCNTYSSFFQGIPGVPIPPTSRIGDINQQGSGHGGEGSCAIASLNFVVRKIWPDTPKWTPGLSLSFRLDLLLRIIALHFCATEAAGTFFDWTMPFVFGYDGDSTEMNSLAYYMFLPTDCHPIHRARRLFEQHSPLSYLPATGGISFDSSSLTSLHGLSIPEKNVDSDPFTSSSVLGPSPKIAVKEESRTELAYERPKTPFIDLIARVSQAKANRKKRRAVFVSPEKVKSTRNVTRSPSILSISPPTFQKSQLPKTPERPSPSAATFAVKRSPSLFIVSPPRNLSRSAGEYQDRKRPKSEQRGLSDNPIVLGSSDSEYDDVKPSSGQTSQQRDPVTVVGRLSIGKVYNSFEAARDEVYDVQAQEGYVWVTKQSKRDPNSGHIVRHTLRCNHSYIHKPTKSIQIDPSDHRNGRSVKTGCTAHVNICTVPHSSQWRITLLQLEHNHARQIPEGGTRRYRPTERQKALIGTYASTSTTSFTRAQISDIVKAQIPSDHPLEPRQVSNILANSRREARQEVDELGGDVAAILQSLEQKQADDPNWMYRVRLDSTQTVIGIFWQSPDQARLTRRFHDVVLNDSAYNRNSVQYPLDIAIIIDQFGQSKNGWYALTAVEDIASKVWLYQQHLEVTGGRHPEVFISDRHASIIAAASSVFVFSHHLYCLHHLDGNITSHVRSALGSDFGSFREWFWKAYRAPSPDAFESAWSQLTSLFPIAADYLNGELYSCRDRWAWAWISQIFTAGVRTTGRSEGENRVNKFIGGPKKSLKQLFDGLNDRTNQQSSSTMVAARDQSRRQHDRPIEKIYTLVLSQLRQHAGPRALHICYREMERSLAYRAEHVQLPDGFREWDEYALKHGQEGNWTWKSGDEKATINDFSNDNAFISTRWLLNLINNRGQSVQHLVNVQHLGGDTVHWVAILRDGQVICDCCMQSNMGLPCRHYFHLLTVIPWLRWSITYIRPRWLQNPCLDTSQVTDSTLQQLTSSSQAQSNTLRNSVSPPSSKGNKLLLQSKRPLIGPADPFQNAQFPAQRPTDTVPAREVYHEARAALTPLLNTCQTREDVDRLIARLNDLREEDRQAAHQEGMFDPPQIVGKGRPRTQRLTGALEGRPLGGGGRRQAAQSPQPSQPNPAVTQTQNITARRQNQCGKCHQYGHNARGCRNKSGR